MRYVQHMSFFAYFPALCCRLGATCLPCRFGRVPRFCAGEFPPPNTRRQPPLRTPLPDPILRPSRRQHFPRTPPSNKPSPSTAKQSTTHATVGVIPVYNRTDPAKPEIKSGEVVFTAYTLDGIKDPEDRPVTFAMNGGPGASSVYLNFGAIGPQTHPVRRTGRQPVRPSPPHR